MTIRSKLILLYSGLLAIIVVAFGITLYAVTRWVLINSVDNTLNNTANQIVENSNAYVVPNFGGPSRIIFLLPSDLDFFGASGVGVQVWQIGPDAPTLLNYSPNLSGYSKALDLDAINAEQKSFQDADDTVGSLSSTVSINGRELRVLTLPYDTIQGWRVIIQEATPFDSVDQASQGLLVIIVISTCIALLGSVALGLALTSRVLKPIDDITRSAAQITAANDLKTRLKWNGPMDELGQLVSVFNSAMQRLEHLFNVQQRFVADVSHELRTPLTAIRGNIDLIKRYGMDQDSLEAIDSEAQRMSRMVNDLLLLARADNGELKLNLEEVNLDLLIGDAYREARILAKDRDLTITVLDFEAVRIKGDPDRLKQLLFNLINNAIKFTPDGGQITLSLTRDDHYAYIQVKDNGVGIAPEHLQRIFDRFYQADPARVRLGGEGAGLGLSIAQWITQAHGGRIEVESALGEGTTFTITLPHTEQSEASTNAAVTRSRLPVFRRSPPPEKTEKEKVKP